MFQERGNATLSSPHLTLKLTVCFVENSANCTKILKIRLDGERHFFVELQSKTFKVSILETCYTRNYTWANEVPTRVEGAISDQHAADARYHADCMVKLMNKNAVQAAATASLEQSELDTAFQSVIDALTLDKSHIWNSVKLFQLY
jgi:hypothetical protein